MSIQIKVMAGSILLAGMITLTGCNSNNQEVSSPTTAPTEVATATTQPEVSPSTSPTETTPITTPTATDSKKDTTKPSTTSSKKQLNEILKLAKLGKVSGVDYAAHNGHFEDVEAEWGKPDTQEYAGKGMYATYNDKHVVFGFNKGNVIFDVRSSDSALQKLTLKEIEGTLGKPNDTTVNGEDKIYIYKVNKQYQLKFIIPNATGTVDHISVFSERDTFNNMAG